MKFAYKVWHSEADKRESRKLEGQQLADDEVAAMHERLHELVSVNYEVEPAFSVSVITLSPSVLGVLVVLETLAGTEDEADDSIARCLRRINGLDPDLCFIAEPVPRSSLTASPEMQSKLDMLRTRGRTRTKSRVRGLEQAEHIYLSLPGDLPDEEVGLTFERPFHLYATASNVGVPQEYAKLTQLFGEMGRDWSVATRSLARNEQGRTIETFHLEFPDRTRAEFHFDVTTFHRN